MTEFKVSTGVSMTLLTWTRGLTCSLTFLAVMVCIPYHPSSSALVDSDDTDNRCGCAVYSGHEDLNHGR